MTFRLFEASLLGLALSSSPLLAAAASPNVDTAALPRFSAMEFDVPTDPLLASSDPMWKPHATPQVWLTSAQSAMAGAIPMGTSAATAMARLTKAGARCRQTSPVALSCSYHTVETRDEYVDDVRWSVNVGLRDRVVQQLAVQRSWTRH